MSQSNSTPDFEIAALRQKNVHFVDLMKPGSGTPWEDRGSQGMITAFLKTCWRSLFNHRLLLDHMRRPETTSEATGFAVGCAILWALSFAIWNAFRYYQFSSDPKVWDVNSGSQYFIESALESVVIFALVLAMLKIGATMYGKLIAGEAKGRVPEVLIYNCFAYSLGPSLLTLIPGIGWPIAFIWIFANLLTAGRKRMYLGSGGTITNTLLVMAVWLLAAGALWCAIWLVWVYLGIPFGNLRSIAPHEVMTQKTMR